jgi:hypothetical protein
VLTPSDCESTAVKVMSLRKETTEGPSDRVKRVKKNKIKGHGEKREKREK